MFSKTLLFFVQIALIQAFAFAQFEGPSLGDEIQSITRSYDDRLDSIQNEITSLEFQKTQCAIAEQRAKMESKQQKNSQISSALQGSVPTILSNAKGAAVTAGDVVNWAGGNLNQVQIDAQAAERNTIAEIRELDGALKGPDANGVVTVSSGYVTKECNLERDKNPSNPNYSYTRCKRELTRELQADANRYTEIIKKARRDQKDAGRFQAENLSSAATGIAGTVGLGLGITGAHSGQKSRDNFSAMDRKSCEDQVQIQIDQAKKQLARIQNIKSQDLLNAQLREAERNRRLAAGNGQTGDQALGPPSGLALGGSQSLTNPQTNFGKNNSGGGAAAGGGGGGGGGSGSDTKGVPWTFGGGQEGAPGGGGLPMQPESATFAADSGGGGDGGGGSTGFGEELAFGPQGLESQDQAADEGGLMALGDGGLLSLLARARARYGAHAAELVKSIDVSKMASSEDVPQKSKPKKKKSDELKINPKKTEKRQPASFL